MRNLTEEEKLEQKINEGEKNWQEFYANKSRIQQSVMSDLLFPQKVLVKKFLQQDSSLEKQEQIVRKLLVSTIAEQIKFDDSNKIFFAAEIQSQNTSITSFDASETTKTLKDHKYEEIIDGVANKANEIYVSNSALTMEEIVSQAINFVQAQSNLIKHYINLTIYSIEKCRQEIENAAERQHTIREEQRCSGDGAIGRN